MKGILLAFIFGMVAIVSCSANAITVDTVVINEDLQLLKLKDSIFVHVSYEESQTYGRFSSNGLIVISNGKAMMVDTPMNNEKTAEISEFLKNKWNVKVEALIVGHFHDDCLGGIEYLHAHNVKSYASNKTIEKCKSLALPVPQVGFEKFLSLDFDGIKIECYYPGGGHTEDNIVVYLPNEKILFGGCLVKSERSRGLGNTRDAVVEDWDKTIEQVKKQFPKMSVVVPGHGAIGDHQLLDHTIQLVKDDRKY